MSKALYQKLEALTESEDLGQVARTMVASKQEDTYQLNYYDVWVMECLDRLSISIYFGGYANKPRKSVFWLRELPPREETLDEERLRVHMKDGIDMFLLDCDLNIEDLDRLSGQWSYAYMVDPQFVGGIKI
jgi:hypothetical protein